MPARPEDDADAPTPRRPLRVLLVDDHEDSRELFREVLELAGHAVTTAGDGPQALALLLEGRFDAALLDVELPGLDGNAVAARAREALGDRVPWLVATTGMARRISAAPWPFDMYLLKPIGIETLLASVASAARARA